MTTDPLGPDSPIEIALHGVMKFVMNDMCENCREKFLEKVLTPIISKQYVEVPR